MKLIDANVLLYAVGSSHPYKKASLLTMEQIDRGEISANINTEVLQEILYYFHRQGKTGEAVRAFDDLVRQFPSPFPILISTAQAARDILERNPHLQSRDAFHAAVVFGHNLEGIISADRAFDRIKGLKRFDPKELAA